MVEDAECRDGAWRAMPEQPVLTKEVPLDTAQVLPDIGYLHWTSSQRLSTCRCSMLFRSPLGGPIVNSSFTYYKNASRYAAFVQWGVEVTRFDLMPQQSQAAFAFVDLLQQGRGHPHRHSADVKFATGPSDNRE